LGASDIVDGVDGPEIFTAMLIAQEVFCVGTRLRPCDVERVQRGRSHLVDGDRVQLPTLASVYLADLDCASMMKLEMYPSSSIAGYTGSSGFVTRVDLNSR
jgi:hypothetical protein